MIIANVFGDNDDGVRSRVVLAEIRGRLNNLRMRQKVSRTIEHRGENSREIKFSSSRILRDRAPSRGDRLVISTILPESRCTISSIFEVLDLAFAGINFAATPDAMTKRTDTDIFKKISDILKRVDSLVKSQDLNRARAEVFHAKELDPNNVYAHAYCERIEMLILKRREADEEEAWRNQKRIEEEERNRPNHQSEIAPYTEALFAAWKTGALTSKSTARLRTLRESLHITPEEHAALDLIVRREYYAEEFKKLWTSNQEVDDGPATIQALRKRWGLAGGESESMEFELINRLRRPSPGSTVLLVDDDVDLLEAVTGVLKDAGLEVFAFTTADEAYEYLLHSTPDIILADINLESSSMGGFGFFEKVQLLPRLVEIPFLFVSGLTDEVVVRAAKELGADDYIAKPFDNDNLVLIIKGKLRRYREMRRVS